MKRFTALVWMVGFTGFLLVGCNSGGSSSSSTVSTGFAVPTEISAVPPNSSASLKTAITVLNAAATDAGTDYSNAVTTKYVEEQTLEQFDIIEQIMQALAQTHYADATNINQGPYKAMIAWQDENNGVETKTLEPWVVDSALITENGQTVNRVRVWIEEVNNGTPSVVKAEFKITAAATQLSDGSFRDFGAWTLHAKMDDLGAEYFSAEATV